MTSTDNVSGESSRKKVRYKLVDWWLTAIAIYTAFIGVTTPIVGFLIFEEKFEEVEEARDAAEAALENAEAASVKFDKIFLGVDNIASNLSLINESQKCLWISESNECFWISESNE